jgi:DNA-directed RNA polymerase specialized sigma24 family protein
LAIGGPELADLALAAEGLVLKISPSRKNGISAASAPGNGASTNGSIAPRRARRLPAGSSNGASRKGAQRKVGDSHSTTNCNGNGAISDGPVADRRLVDQCLSGNADAWRKLFEQQHHRLLASIRAMFGHAVSDANWVEEIAGRVWYELLLDDGKLLGQFDVAQDCRLCTYLSEVARKTAVEMLRAEKRRRRREASVAQPERELSQESENQAIRRLSDFLGFLTPRESGFFVDILVSSTDRTAYYSPTNDWKLRSRIRRKLQEFA